MPKISQTDIAIRHLADRLGNWVRSYELEKMNTAYGYLGIQTGRRLREVMERGYHDIKGERYYCERQHHKYAEYRVTKIEQINYGKVEMREGKPVFVPTAELQTLFG